MSEVIAEVRGGFGLLTLDRPKALNALSLGMIRALTTALLAWRDDPAIQGVAFRGMGKDANSPSGSSPFGAFCAGGDIRFFHQAALAGDAALEAFFDEEYALDHLIARYPKPTIAFMDGIVMGGGMGISQGARLRVVTERTKMAMPETAIGLFPDVGGGYFLQRCPGHVGAYLALTGETIGGNEAVALGLADGRVDSSRLAGLWERLGSAQPLGAAARVPELATEFIAGEPIPERWSSPFLSDFALPDVASITHALEARPAGLARDAAALLRKRSPLMLHVTLEQLRRGRGMSLAEVLRMERDLMWNCFHLRPAPASDTVEGIRALVIDKDNRPRWNPARIEDVTPAQVAAYFRSPWTREAHPLRELV
jgi:enoyl-CoA hydratase/carnithine racemase